MLLILAQAQESTFWAKVIHALSINGLWIFLAICVLAGMANHIVHAVLRHRERLAMIEAGMQPDKVDKGIDKEA